jgi:hypothetical protein
MKTLISYLKSGMFIVSKYLVVIYLTLIGTDIYTTYLVSPDLKYETNWVVNYFHLNFTQIIFLSYFYAIVGITFLFVSIGYFDNYFRKNTDSRNSVVYLLFHNRRLFFSYIGLGYFYFHLFCSAYCTVNNYLGYVYLFDQNNILYIMAKPYIETTHLGIPYYYIYSQGTVAVISYICTVFRIRRLASGLGLSLNQSVVAVSN